MIRRPLASLAIVLASATAAFAQSSPEDACFKNHFILDFACPSPWAPANEGLTDLDIRVVVVDPVDRATVYAGSAGGLFRSRDGALSWNRTGFDPAPLVFPPGTLGNPIGFVHEHRIAHFAIDPDRRDTLYVATHPHRGCYWEQRRFFRSTDGGATWKDDLIDKRLMSGCDHIHSVVLDPANPSTLYVTSFDDAWGDSYAMMARSTDSGATWQYFIDPALNVLAVDPRDSRTVYGGTVAYEWYLPEWYHTPLPKGVLKSTDGGATWAATPLTGFGISALAIDRGHPASLHAAAFRYSTEGKAAFEGLFKSVDSGATWSPAGEGLQHLMGTATTVTAIVIDGDDPATLYLGTSSAGVWRSADGGATWSAFNAGLASLSVRGLALAPGEPNVVYAATEAGVFKIQDLRSRFRLNAARSARFGH